MSRALFRKEILEGIYSHKFLLSFLLALFVIPLSLYLGMSRFRVEQSEFRQSVEQGREELRQQSPKPPHAAAHFGTTVTKPPSALLAFSSGVHDVLGVRSQIDPHLTPQLAGATAERTPILVLFGRLDYAFVIQVIFGLFALILASDMISGEREQGTLKLVLSHSVSRSQVLLGKLLGGALVLLLPVLMATVLGLLFFTPAFGVHLEVDQWLRVLAIVVMSMVYLLMMFVLGLWASSMTRSSRSSMILVLIVWVAIIFVVPRAAAGVAQRIQALPSSVEIESQLRGIQETERDNLRQKTRDYLKEYPQLSASRIPPEVATEYRRAMDEAVEIQEARLQQNLDVAKNRQVVLATNLARASPATAYLLVATDLAATGVARHRRFQRYLNEYRISFRSHFDDLELQGVDRVDDFSTVPFFEYQEETFAQVLPRRLPDIGLLVGVSLLLFALAYVSFIRYDVR